MHLACTNAQPDFNQESTDFITKPLQTIIRICAHKLCQKNVAERKPANQPPLEMSAIKANRQNSALCTPYIPYIKKRLRAASLLTLSMYL